MTEFAEIAPQMVEACPRCRQSVRVGRSKKTGTLILHCPSCKTYFPEAANEKRMVDTNVIAGWNLFSKLQAKLERGEELTPTDFAVAMQPSLKQGKR
jgi:hypothetical protein